MYAEEYYNWTEYYHEDYLPEDYRPARVQPVEADYDHHIDYLKDLTTWPTDNGRQLKNQATEIATEWQPAAPPTTRPKRQRPHAFDSGSGVTAIDICLVCSCVNAIGMCLVRSGVTAIGMCLVCNYATAVGMYPIRSGAIAIDTCLARSGATAIGMCFVCNPRHGGGRPAARGGSQLLSPADCCASEPSPRTPPTRPIIRA